MPHCKYDNCFGKADETGCLAHRPSEKKDIKKFYPEIDKLLEQSDHDKLNFFCFRFPENKNYFKNITIDKEVVFDNSVFDGKISFEGATFEKRVSFNGVDFSKDVSFEDATFKEKITFNQTDDKKKTVFEGKAIFTNITTHKITEFKNAEFSDKTNFERANLNMRSDTGPVFNNSTFKECADFNHVTFGGPGPTGFLDVKFNKKVSFNGAVFMGKASFDGASFGDELDFTQTDFLSGVSMYRKTKDKQSNEYSEENWNEKFTLNSANQEACRVQRIQHKKRGRIEEADNFFLWEKRAENRQRKYWRKTLYDLFDLTMEYGTNWLRFLKISLLIILSILLFEQLIIIFQSVNLSLLTEISKLKFENLAFDWNLISYGFTLQFFESLFSIFATIFVALVVRKWSM